MTLVPKASKTITRKWPRPASPSPSRWWPSRKRRNPRRRRSRSSSRICSPAMRLYSCKKNNPTSTWGRLFSMAKAKSSSKVCCSWRPRLTPDRTSCSSSSARAASSTPKMSEASQRKEPLNSKPLKVSLSYKSLSISIVCLNINNNQGNNRL